MGNLTMDAVKWRCIGPPRGGRVVAVVGHPTDDRVHYFGGCAGGVWQTEDGGAYWRNVSDGYFGSAAIGAIAISESDPNVIYVGTGESTIRGDVSYGDGVYKSTDGGRSWRNVGLRDTHHIGEIRIHPQNPDLVYVAALGHAFGPNAERGVYRSKDGGETWEQVLFKSEKAGAVDLALDTANPRVLYASIWETYRNFWSLSSGGPDSGLYKSTDGGDTWEEISANPGLPGGIKGKIGVTVSPARPQRVWAIIEAKKGGVYRSDDGGATWERTSDDQNLLARPWYYCHIFADPQDENTVYVTNLRMWKSTDGGRNFSEITTPHGDNHDLWIDPKNPKHMIEGNDGGACVTYNGGITWSSIYNQMTGQFYHLDLDNQFPFRVYGTQQDNSSISTPSATEWGCIPWNSSHAAGTGESGYIAVKPDDPNVVFVGAVGSSPGGGGALQRYDHRTGQLRLVTVWPELYSGLHPKDLKYRFAWTFPIVFSPHDPNLLYTSGNHIFKSTNEGQSWEIISPDLSRNDAEKLMASGGPLTLDTSGAEHYGTVFALAESPHEAGVLWAGTDDGRVHLSKNGGESWEEITPATLPDWTLVSLIEPSPHDAATAYMACTRYKLDDYAPYLYKTADYGGTWERLSFPEGEITRAVREDPKQAGLLYVGTETGIFFSADGGASWQRVPGNLPVVPVYDLKIKDDALVVATHGRAFWILDDLTPLRQMRTITPDKPHLFPPAETVRRWEHWSVGVFTSTAGKSYMMALGASATAEPRKLPPADVEDTAAVTAEFEHVMLDAGENPPRGVTIYYFLPDGLDEAVSLQILDADNKEIRTFRSDAAEEDKPRLPKKSGLNRFVWDMRYPDATKIKGDPLSEGNAGPLAPPGDYVLKLKVGNSEQTECFRLVKDPRVVATAADFKAQFELWSALRDKISETHEAVMQIRRLRGQVESWLERVGDKESDQEREGGESKGKRVRRFGEALKARLDELEGMLIQTEAKTRFDRLRLPAKLNAKLATLVSVVGIADAPPTDQARAVFESLSAEVDAVLADLNRVLADELVAFNTAVQEAGLSAVGL